MRRARHNFTLYLEHHVSTITYTKDMDDGIRFVITDEKIFFSLRFKIVVVLAFKFYVYIQHIYETYTSNII